MAKCKADRWRTPEGLKQLTQWAERGLTDEQIAYNMGIYRTTLYDYKKQFEDINDALNEGKRVADVKVENMLYKKALGECTTAETERRLDSAGNLEVVRETIKQVPADTTAMVFWLKNRQPDKWRDKQDIGLSASGFDVTIKVDE